MTEFNQEIKEWVDHDGLIGNKKNPEKWSTGNGILETAIAIHLCKKHGAKDLAAELTQAVGNCWYNQSLHKNPGRADQISHDDIIAFSSIDQKFAALVCNVGVRNGWDLGNSGFYYYDAQAKLWHQAYYLAASKEFVCGLHLAAVFWSACILGAFTASYSGIRKWYLMRHNRPPQGEAIFGPLFDFIIYRRFGSFKAVQQGYYDDASSSHVLIKYA